MSWRNASQPYGKSEGIRTEKVAIGHYSKVPARLFGSGMAARLGPSATLLYVALCEHGNRHGKNTFKASDRALASDTGLSPRTICNARKAILENKLIDCSREEGESFQYTLRPLQLDWVPMAKRPRTKRKPRAHHALPSSQPQQTLLDPRGQNLLSTHAKFAEPAGKLC